MFQNVFRSKSFHEMSAPALAQVLESDNLNMDENDILAAVKEWATVNSVGFRANYCWLCSLAVRSKSCTAV